MVCKLHPGKIVNQEIGLPMFIQIHAREIVPFEAFPFDCLPVNHQFPLTVHQRGQYFPVPVQPPVHFLNGAKGLSPFSIVVGIFAFGGAVALVAAAGEFFLTLEARFSHVQKCCNRFKKIETFQNG